MWYAVISEDQTGSLEKRMAARPDHIARLEALGEEGRLLLAGPHPAIDAVDPGPAGFTGSLVIADFPSLHAATEWANNDPYVATGVYRKVTVKPFNRVLP